MSATLRLDYTCTGAEMEEAQSLHLRKQVGRGSKWRTYVVLFGMLFVMLLALYFRTRQEVPAAYRLYVYAAIFVLFVVIFLWLHTRHRKRSFATTRIEVTSADFTILGADSKVTMPWSAFSDCLESANLFVLVDRPKGMLMVLPKRAVPSESWRSWFRERAGNRPHPALQPPVDAPVMTFARTSDQITLNFRLACRDYLDLTLASWFT